jgi:DNA-binding CsgD family transcriptional regulator
LQLDKLIAFHKTMGDAQRIRIVTLLAAGPKHGGALAGILGITPPTVSHHLSKLKDINIIKDRRDKNTVYYFLNEDVLHYYSEALPKLISNREEEKVTDEKTVEYKKILGNFLSKDGRLKTIPAQRKKKLIILHHLASHLESGRRYEEKEINEFITKFHEDYATIRREFIINAIMFREKGIYELNPKELWASIK